MNNVEDDAPTEQPAINAVREAMLEMIMDRIGGGNREQIAYELNRRAKATDYDLGVELCHLIRHEPIVIPAATTGRPCAWCKATVFWVPFDDTVHKQSVSIAGNECIGPTVSSDGVGFAHLADCPKSGLRLKEYGTLDIWERRAGTFTPAGTSGQAARDQSGVSPSPSLLTRKMAS